ncbi:MULTISPECIES: DUF2784 domain-containing protein [unclassified Nocardiopsis]|uniref:DUF2784 domain-containing protein n=1 Tax=unclassified Nocardiopsis TaxID=2649073 RepID=UPI001359B90E|nr:MULTISPECIES: DUF2784 domain-containing protein [unclassified Nocardiopsis]
MSFLLLVGHVAAALHFAFLAFVVLGGFVAWRWPRWWWAHLAVAAYALGIVFVDWPCVLTEMENWSRERTGRPVMERGFIDFYLTGSLYPREHLLTSRLVMAGVVALSWAGAGWSLVRRRAGSADGAAAVSRAG